MDQFVEVLDSTITFDGMRRMYRAMRALDNWAAGTGRDYERFGNGFAFSRTLLQDPLELSPIIAAEWGAIHTLAPYVSAGSTIIYRSAVDGICCWKFDGRTASHERGRLLFGQRRSGHLVLSFDGRGKTDLAAGWLSTELAVLLDKHGLDSFSLRVEILRRRGVAFPRASRYFREEHGRRDLP
ncbi:hypothetical protein [Conexibacter sp. CPCC 206217]|uniref:hypothetical protein n=1 Tax=Conexibacter sp. CPCC 206217 TaxID=3064574 RepID=UPI0027211A7B|nr:hypothetical protein [Conexibacter sp. CPCC 206217]MDO8208963.1 hypothetical protein [Conexibacter sp. CPCC 206217]